MGADRGAELEQTEGAVYCARHPGVETYLRCGRCGTPICPRCLVQSPVGARCPDCAKLTRLPTFTLSPWYIARGFAAAVASGAAVGVFWGGVVGSLFNVILILLAGLAVGWLISEAISIATNRKRGPWLQGFAVIGAIVAYGVQNVVAGNPILVTGDEWSYVLTGIAALFGMSRLKGW